MPHIHSAQFNNLPELYDPTYANFRSGDVLIHHADKSQKFSSNPYHASIMAERQAIRTMCNFDSCPGHNGVSSRTMNNFGDLAVVFRPTAKPDYGDAAGQLAVQMCGQVGYSSGVAGMGRALRVPFHTSAYTNKTAARLLKYDNRGQRPRNVICTELCVICYQLAIGNPHDPYFPRLDGKFLHPGELESYFLQNATYWSLVGKVTGPNAHG